MAYTGAVPPQGRRRRTFPAYRLIVVAPPFVVEHARLALRSSPRHARPHLWSLLDDAAEEAREPTPAELEAAEEADRYAVRVLDALARELTASGPAYEAAVAAEAARTGRTEDSVRNGRTVDLPDQQFRAAAPQILLGAPPDAYDHAPIVGVAENLRIVDWAFIAAVASPLPEHPAEAVPPRSKVEDFLRSHLGRHAVVLRETAGVANEATAAFRPRSLRPRTKIRN